MSLRGRLILGLLLGLVALLAISGTLLYAYINRVLAGQFDAALVAEADAICSLIKLQPNGEVEADLPPGPTSPLGDAARPQYFQIWREDGSVLVRSPALGQRHLPRAAASETPEFVGMELPQGRPGKALLLRFVPVAEDEDVPEGPSPTKPTVQPAQQKVIVAVAQDRSELKRMMAVLFSALLGIAALMVLGTVAVVSVVVQQGLRPLRRVAAEAARIDAQTLAFRFSLDGLPRELQPICLRLNDSLERLQRAFERQRRFTANAAHELRTPIAELRSLADVALKWDGDRETSLGYFRDAQQIARQMQGIVTTLLSLARCQAGTMTVVHQPVNLSDLLREAWEGCRQEAADRHLAVTFDLPDRLLLNTDPAIVHSMLSNLLGNAVEYARIGGTISCTTKANDSAVQVRVINDTDSLTPDDLPHLFEAFWRKDAARTDGLHCGLGLTLVDAYAAALGGKAEVNLPTPQSLCVTLNLPI